MLAERYRIVGLLGRGGMGEVYRAEDLKLGQPVALKFLPTELSQDEAALARFHREVRTARNVSHPNVCRVFDIGEVDGQHFLSMEYIDGEDLASLLRRIGRLPGDKALEIARQLCAGLAAAHEAGVLHRDLKPANVMIDGRGKARITDFGLAGLADGFHPGEVRAGTPAYMAPEQLSGLEVTIKSDIYSLGLVLYELFTGKRAFEAAKIADLVRLHQQISPANPSTLVKELDPAVERVILRCLEKEPRARPATALQVALALPGGDPLAAALAAGETPSPELVAASGQTEGLRPAVAWAYLAAALLGILASILLSAQAKLYRRVPLEKPPDVLAERAREILRTAGYTDVPAGTAFGFYEDADFFRYVDEHDKSKTRWDHLETGAMGFWYRSSPRPLEQQSFAGSTSVTPNDPPLDVSGMSLVRLNPQGRLTYFVLVPPQVEDTSGPTPSPDWARLFSPVGLDPSQWKPAEPKWLPPVYSDVRAAWTGTLPERPSLPMRIEAAAYRGKPVYFELVGPWTRPTRMQPFKRTTAEQVARLFALTTLLSLVVGGVLLAQRNIRMGRGDRRGAFRLASFVFVLSQISFVFGASHVPNFYEIWLVVMSISLGLFQSGFLWVLYIALEPYVRRRWPAILVSWSRVLAGGVRDPLVGRDVLVGSLVGALMIVLPRTGYLAPAWFGAPPGRPFDFSVEMLLGTATIISQVLGYLIGAIFLALVTLFLLFLLRLLLRNEWAAAGAYVLISIAVNALQTDTPLVLGVVTGIRDSLTVFLLVRFGLIALIAAHLIANILSNFPLTTQASAWYAGTGFAGILLMAAITFYGFYASLGGRPMFGAPALEEE